MPLEVFAIGLKRRNQVGGADGIRTHDLLDAIEARSQLRHGPTGVNEEILHQRNGCVHLPLILWLRPQETPRPRSVCPENRREGEREKRCVYG